MGFTKIISVNKMNRNIKMYLKVFQEKNVKDISGYSYL